MREQFQSENLKGERDIGVGGKIMYNKETVLIGISSFGTNSTGGNL
jgi:hypothetical protein